MKKIILIYCLFHLSPSLLLSNSNEDIFSNPTIRQQLIQFIMKTVKPTNFWDTFRNRNAFLGFAGSLVIPLITSAVLRFIHLRYKNMLIKSEIRPTKTKNFLLGGIEESTQDITKIILVVSKKEFPFESILLFTSSHLQGNSFISRLANQIEADLYVFSDLKKEIKKLITKSRLYSRLIKKVEKPILEKSETQKTLNLSDVTDEELLVHLVNKVKTRRGNPPKKVIIFFDTLSLTKMKNFKTLINPTDLSENKSFNNVIFITATQKGFTKNNGKEFQAEIDRFQRKIEIPQKEKDYED